MSLTSLPHEAEPLTGIFTSVPFPFAFAGRQRQSTLLESRTRTSGPPVVMSFGSATFVPEAFCPAVTTAVAVFLARSMRQTVLAAVSSTYGAPSDPRTRPVSATGLSLGNVYKSVDSTLTTPYRRSSPASACWRSGAICAGE